MGNGEKSRVAPVKARAELLPDSEAENGSDHENTSDSNLNPSNSANRQLFREMEQQPMELHPASDKSASIINSAFQSQSGKDLVRLRTTSLSPQKRHSEDLSKGSRSKPLRSRIVDVAPGNGIGYSNLPTKQNNGRLNRPTQKAGPSGTRVLARRTCRNPLDIPPEPAVADISAGISTTSRALSEAREVHRVSSGQFIDPLASKEAPIEDDSTHSAVVNESIVDGTPAEPETPARGRGRPRKAVSENHGEMPKKSNRPRGRPPKKKPQMLLADTKTPKPLDRPCRQGSSVTHDVVGQEISKASAGTHTNATRSSSQSKLLDQSNEGSISELPDNAVQVSPGDRASGREGGSADESEYRDASERRDVTSDNSMERLRAEDNPKAYAEHDSVQSEIHTGLELFNQEEILTQISKAARKIRRRRVSLARRSGTIRPQTQTFRVFIRRVKEASTCYQKLAGRTDSEEEAEQSLDARLKANLKWLHSEVDALDIPHAGNKSRKMVKDIYAQAIPGMVSLLRYAFEARSPSYSAPGETRTLNEIIRLLETTHTLCQKARTWPVQLNPELSIVGPTSKVIYPNIRGMLGAFQGELDHRIEANRRAAIENHVPRMHSQHEALLLKRREETDRAKKRWLERAAADAQKKISGRVPFRPSHPPSQQAPKQDQWNEEQDDALLMMLMNPAIAKQPLDVRYTSVLNTPLLQNKLPEHIEKRAMYWKPSMETSYANENRPIPHWVSSLEHLAAVHSTI